MASQAQPVAPAPVAKKKVKSAELFKKLRSLHDAHRIDASRLETIQKLGEGGFAFVDLCWFAEEDGRRTQVAVKRVRPDVLKHTTQLKLFTNESEILVKIKHEHIVKLIGLGSLDDSTDESLRDSFFLVEELVDGGSLRLIVLHQMINAPEQLYRIRDGVRWSLQMAKALQYLHGMNPVVVHRDLKPDNVLLTSHSAGLDPHVADIKLADFGLSVMIPNKHVAVEAKTQEPVNRNPQREARWNKNMGPSSSHSLSGAAAMLHMVEGASMASGYHNGSMCSIPAGMAGQAHPGSSATIKGSEGVPRSQQYLAPSSRMGPGSSRIGGVHSGALNSRMGPHSRAGPSSRPVSGILSMLGIGGATSQRQLECPSGIMFDLTSMTGSLLYMAPEVFKGQPYNYKADTFSFGVLMYELLHQRLIMATLIAQQIEDRHTFENEIMEFTKCVSAGFRPPIEDWLPDYMRQLITKCWAQNATDRPSMAHVVEILERFLASPELTAIDKAREPSCCRMC